MECCHSVHSTTLSISLTIAQTGRTCGVDINPYLKSSFNKSGIFDSNDIGIMYKLAEYLKESCENLDDFGAS